MHIKGIVYFLLLIFFIQACKDDSNDGLTNPEIDLGIKTVLNIGADSAISAISINNGLINDRYLKLMLPNEGRAISDIVDWYSLYKNVFFSDLNINLNYYHLKTLQALRNATEQTTGSIDTLLKMNIKAIKYTNGQSIINGVVKNKVDSNAILVCFQNYASEALYINYKPKLKIELTKALPGADTNSYGYWETLVDKYNLIAERARQVLINDSVIGGGFLKDNEKIYLKKFVQVPDTTILDEYVTKAVLGGVYDKLGYIEKQIRLNPVLWNGKANGDILQRAFRK